MYIAYKILFFSITLLAVMGVAIPLPILPDIAYTFSLSTETVGWVIIAYTLPGVFIALLAGILADRFGRKIVLVPGVLFFAIGGLACAFAHTFSMLLFFRVIQGCGGGVIGVLYSTLPADMYSEKDLPKVMGQISAVASIGIAIFPTVGGFLGEIVWHAPFWLSAFAFPVGLLAVKLPLVQGSTQVKWKEYFKETEGIITNPIAIVFFSLTFLSYCIYYGPVNTYFPMMTHERFGVSSSEIGNLFVVLAAGIGTSAISLGWLNKHFRLYILLLIAGFSYLCAQCLFVLMPKMNGMLVPLFFEGFAQGITLPILSERIAILSPKENRAAVMAVNGTIFRLSQSVSPVIFGFGWTLLGWKGPYIMGIVSAICIICIVRVFIKNSLYNKLVML